MASRRNTASGPDTHYKVLQAINEAAQRDAQRIASSLPAPAQRRLAQVLQFTLPGSPNIYYGSELGMTGGGDPEMRAPMRWDLARDDNATLAWTRRLIGLRKQHRALRVGNFRLLGADKLLAFERYTDRIRDAVLVLANPTRQAVTETVLIPDSKFMNMGKLLNLLDPSAPPVPITSALIMVTLAADLPGYSLESRIEPVLGDPAGHRRSRVDTGHEGASLSSHHRRVARPACDVEQTSPPGHADAIEDVVVSRSRVGLHEVRPVGRPSTPGIA